MAQIPELDLDLLVAPIPGNDPAGSPLADDVRRKLDDLRKEPDEFDLQGGAAGKKADWIGVANLAEATLMSSSKDLLVAVRLLEALARVNGFEGLQQGFLLLTRLVNEGWDRLHPQPDPGEDMSVRVGPFRWMNDSTRGAKFPATIAGIALFKRDDVNYSYLDVAPAARADKREEFERVFDSLKASELQEFKKTAEKVRAAYAGLRELGAALDHQLGELSPDLISQENPDNLGRTMHGLAECVERLLKKSGLEGSPSTESENKDSGIATNDSSAAPSIDAKRASREGLYRQVGQIAEALSQLEPHSPIPYLLKRIVKLGALPFPELMRELVRETATIEEFDRLLGIRQPPAEGQ